MSLSSYLAKNYLTASSSNSDPYDPDSTRPKKRRKKGQALETNTLIIADDDDDLILSSKTTSRQNEDPDYPQFDNSSRSAEFRKSKKNNWKNLTNAQQQDAEAAEADRILATAAQDADRARAEIEMEDAPAIVGTSESGPKMSSGARAGLQTAADSAALEMEATRQRNAEAKAQKMRKKEQDLSDPEADPESQTVYRDATGRRIDISMKRAEARAAEAEKLRAERKEKEDAMGDVQRQQKEQRKQDLEEAKFLTFARGAEDEEMNDELKNQVRWDDPMAAYMASKQPSTSNSKGGNSASLSTGGGPLKARRKEYQGAAPPNRYGIKPGWRWDGVDRGNGFEKEWFQARGKKSRNENLQYQWQMDE